MKHPMEWLAILNAAASDEGLEEPKRLLDDGCDPNTVHPEVGNIRLYNACFANKLEHVALLLERGADPNKKIGYVRRP